MHNIYTDLKTAIFFCQQIDKEQDVNRRTIEKEFGSGVKFFPVPCSGRIEPLHFMRSFESGLDKIFVITCPEGACRYREGNLRAMKRLEYTQGLIEEIGLERERLELIQMKKGVSVKIDELAWMLLNNKDLTGIAL